MALLEIAGLTKRYGDSVVLDDVGLTVERGEILGLIGPNGSGKTTLLECLAGLLPADAGQVRWDGTPLGGPARKTALFYLPDGIAPYAEHTVRAVLSFFATIYSLSDAQTAETIATLGLAPVLDKPAGALSKGFRRRLVLALGLLTPHPLLVMDEPFDGFDLHQTREIMGVLRRLVGRGRSLMLAIHQLTDAERICDRFVLLAAGCVRGAGTLAAIRRAAGVDADAGLEEVFLALT
ncbi:MAG TPA: ABC transporter ATP-binding protein [Alphaproteobacteria bacterium]